MRAFPALLLPLALLTGCAGAPPAPAASPGTLHVRLMHLERAVPGALVTAVRNPGSAFLEERVAAPAGADGGASLALPPGTWFLAAAAERPALFGWYGSNPVQVRPGEAAEIAIRAVPAPPLPAVAAVPAGEESVAGDVVGEEGPVADASVAFYLDAATQFRGPGYLETRTDDAGRFAARLSPGRYWIVARRRAGTAAFGPLEVGDAFGYYAGNPLVVAPGAAVAVRVGAVRVMKKSGWGGPSGLRTRVSGTIRDGAGRPLAGYRAFLHAQPAMLGKPEFVSEPSGPDGAYLVWVDREGTFYLGAREEIGRAREERETIGLYRGSPDHAVVVRLGTGELPPLDVVVDAGDAR